MRIVVLGAAGQLGREIVRVLIERGHVVRAVVRRPGPTTAAELVVTDCRNKADVRAALTGNNIVINAIGAGTLRRNDVESATTAVAVAAAQDVRVQRYFAMSAGMVALDSIFFNHILRPLIFRNIVTEHCRVEEIVKASDLDWTIVRPSKLTNRAPKGYVASLHLRPRAFSTTRADVAAFIADEIDNASYIKQAVFVTSRDGHSSAS